MIGVVTAIMIPFGIVWGIADFIKQERQVSFKTVDRKNDV